VSGGFDFLVRQRPLEKRPDEGNVRGEYFLKQHMPFSRQPDLRAPFVAGDRFTLADILFLYSVDLAALVARRQFGLDLLAQLPAAVELLQRLGENANVKAIAARRDAATPAFIAAIRSRYGAAG